MSPALCSSYGTMLNIYSILADEEVRQGLKVWVSHDQFNIEIIADI